MLTRRLAICLTLAATFAHAQSSKEEDQVRRLRMQMRQIQQQQQEAQDAQAKTDQARKQAEQSLKAQESVLNKQRAVAATASRQAASLARELEVLKAEHAKTKDELIALSTRHQALEVSARGLQEQLQTSQHNAQRLNTAGVRLLDMNKRCVADNATLADLGTQLLQRYEDKGIGEVLGAKEPFLQFGRVRLENLKAEYAQGIAAASIKASEVSTGTTLTPATPTPPPMP